MKLRALIYILLILITGHGYTQSTDDEIKLVSLENDLRAIRLNTEHWGKGHGLPEEYLKGFYEENLVLGFYGSVYHVNLVNYNLDLELGLSQQDTRGQGKEAFDNAFISNLSLTTNWLKEKPYSFSTFVDWRDHTQNYELFERLNIKEFLYGGSGQFTNEVAPFYYTIEKSEREETSALRVSLEDVFTVDLGVSTASKAFDSLSKFDYTHNDFLHQSHNANEQIGKSHSVSVSNSLSFGSEQAKSRLNSSIRYMSLRGTQNTDSLNLAQNMDLRHGPDLSSRFSNNINWTENEVIEVASHQARIRLEHQLYESLSTTADVFGSVTGATNYNEQSYGPSVDFKYRKNIMIGFLNLDYHVSNNFKRRNASTQEILIVDERHTLTSGVITFLENFDIDENTVLVTDTSGTTAYVPNMDYALVGVGGGRIQISRMAGGNISNGSTVLVDYMTTKNNSFDYILLKQKGGVRMEFLDGGLSVSYRILTQQFPQSDGMEKRVLDIVNGHTLGASLDIFPLNMSFEYEDYDSSISPFIAVRLRQSVSFPFLRSRLNFQSSQGVTQFEHGDQKQRLSSFNVQYILPISQSAVLSLSSGFQSQDGTGISSTLSTAKASFAFQKGLLAFKAGYEFEGENIPIGNQKSDHLFYMELKRRF